MVVCGSIKGMVGISQMFSRFGRCKVDRGIWHICIYGWTMDDVHV
jgi:hypothetical protein